MKYRPISPVLTQAALLVILSLGLGASRSDALGATADQPAGGSCASALGKLPVAAGQVLPERFRVMSWNIHKTEDAGWAQDLLRLGADSDLNFIQEASLQAKLGELWPDGPVYQAFAEGYATPQRETGVMTLSLQAPTLQCNFTRMEPWLGTPKAAAVTEYAINGSAQRLLAVNIHAVNFTLGLEDLQHQLAPLVELLAHHQGPVILAGDFNTWSGQRTELVDRTLRQQGLSQLAFQPDLRSRFFGRPLDHIYVRGLVADTTEVVPVTSSDHNPLLAWLRLAE